MIDRSKVKKMYVWNKECDNKLKRYVVVKNSDGSCYAVDYTSEGEWENNTTSDITLMPYLHYKEIPEEKYRHFKAEEITEEFFDYLFRHKNTGRVCKIKYLDFNDGDNSPFNIEKHWLTPKELFEEYEMKKPIWQMVNAYMYKTYTDWMPAGVKE